MCLYSYVIARDYGFAPNPFGGICSLATCKPQIREHAKIGDWVSGFGGANTEIEKKMVFLMRVDETCTFDEYWKDERFLMKKPCFDSNYQRCYGDNIYHHVDGKWMQENSHHSYENGINEINLLHDTRIDRILLSYYFWYFGDKAIELPHELSDAVASGRGCRKLDKELCVKIIEWISERYTIGQHGFPYKWHEEEGFARFKGERT